MIPTVHAGNDFGGLLDYLQKPGHSLLEPLDMPVDQMIEQMRMVAELSARSTRPVKHLIRVRLPTQDAGPLGKMSHRAPSAIARA